MMRKSSLKEVRLQEQMKKDLAERQEQIKREVNEKKKNAPALTQNDRKKIDAALIELQKSLDYTFWWGEEEERIEDEYRTKGQRVPNNKKIPPIMLNDAIRKALDKREEIHRILRPYKFFSYEHPDTTVGGIKNIVMEHSYQSPHKEVAVIEQTLNEMRTYSEQVNYEYRKNYGLTF